MAISAVERRAEIKTRTTDELKREATEVYARWGLSLNDAINTFLAKSIEVGGLPFDLHPTDPTYDALARRAYKAPLNEDGIAVLPAEWNDMCQEGFSPLGTYKGRNRSRSRGAITHNERGFQAH